MTYHCKNIINEINVRDKPVGIYMAHSVKIDR